MTTNDLNVIIMCVKAWYVEVYIIEGLDLQSALTIFSTQSLAPFHGLTLTREHIITHPCRSVSLIEFSLTHTISLTRHTLWVWCLPLAGGGVIVPRWAPVTPSLSILLLRWTERQSLSLQRFKTFDSLFLEVNKHQFHSVGSGATASKDHVRIKSAVSGMQLPALSKGGDGGGGFKKHKWVTTSYNSHPTLISRQPNKALNSQFRHMRYSPCPLCTKYK